MNSLFRSLASLTSFVFLFPGGSSFSSDHFADGNLVAWCIVPFDAARRGPAERAAMLNDLGLRRCAYDWRAEQVDSFEEEIVQYKKHGIEFFAFWAGHPKAYELFAKYKISPQIWKTLGDPGKDAGSYVERVDAAAQSMVPTAEAAEKIGSKLGLYNHGGWGGEPENLVAVCERLRQLGHQNVGIVYNFHHGHGHIHDWAESFALMKPYLLCLNLNGMNADAKPMILPIGKGSAEREMIRVVRDSDYTGPIGILDHRNELDARQSLQENITGLHAVLAEEKKTTAPSLLFISAFSSGERGSIHAFSFHKDTGKLTLLHRNPEVENPFFLALSPDGHFLYSIYAKAFGGKEDEEVASFVLEGRSGKLRFLNRQSSRGTASCYLDVDATGKTLVVANYSSGSVVSLPLNRDGSLGKAVSFFQHEGSGADPARQSGPHAHSIVISPDNRFALSADLGTDRIFSYQLDPVTSKLSVNSDQASAKTKPGAGPRHLIFHPDGQHVYVINELGNSVTLFDYDGVRGTLNRQQSASTLPDQYEGKSYCADLKITPDGRFLYGTNRGNDSIAIFRIDQKNGHLTRIGIEPSLGKGPQNLAILSGGKWLICANMAGNNVAVFRIDQETGKLSSVGKPVAMPMPSCIRVVE